MFLPNFQATLTPTQFTTFMRKKAASELVILLALQDGNVFVMADDELPASLLIHCSSIPLTIVPNQYTTQQFTAFLEASADFYQWAYYLDEEEFQKRALESLLQRVEPATILPLAMCIKNVQNRRKAQVAA
ncbi:hypothetical protein [uncultured Fibrella sp.]|uniref:hypothetical protein n=1 Tax=uncultured Fibrella sp. TaxID=1284596 RepID=UPI0035CC1E3D